MNIERHYKIIGLLWLMVGGGNSIAFIMQLYRVLVILRFELTHRSVESLSLGVIVSFLTFLSGWALLKRPIWGRIAIFIVSLIYIAYGVLYILFAAPEEEGTVATIITMCLLVLGLYSFFFLLVTEGRK